MQTALRKMGNSTGLIVPSAVLREAGLARGAVLEVAVEDGHIVATPVVTPPRASWAADAAALATAPVTAEEAKWLLLPNEGDAELAW